ncbi:ATP-grasp domain-containing protein [Arthrobacter sp. KFRI-F3372]|nr:ATP-grasp domain-containing protein [Arthrobacter sp. KFRI-F3372]
MRIVAVGTNRPCHYRLIDSGHEVYLAIQDDRVIESDRSRYAGILSIDAEEGKLLDNSSFPNDVDAVTYFHDAYAQTAVNIADRARVPHRVDLEIAARFRDKAATRKIISTIEPGHVAHRVIPSTASDAEALAIALPVGFPCIAKPLTSEASMGVTFASDKVTLANAIKVARAGSENGSCIVEEHLVGPEFSVESLSIDGLHYILAVTEKFTYPGTAVECGHVIPASIPEEDQVALAHAASEVLTKLGLLNGPSHSEFILTDNGPRLIESHDRMGGDRIGLLVELATGIDYTGLVARLGVGLKIPPEAIVAKSTAAAAVWFAKAELDTRGVIRAIDGLDSARCIAFVDRVEVLKKPGSTIGPLEGSFDRTALAVAVAPVAEKALTAARDAVASISFSVEGIRACS